MDPAQDDLIIQLEQSQSTHQDTTLTTNQFKAFEQPQQNTKQLSSNTFQSKIIVATAVLFTAIIAGVFLFNRKLANINHQKGLHQKQIAYSDSVREEMLFDAQLGKILSQSSLQKQYGVIQATTVQNQTDHQLEKTVEKGVAEAEPYEYDVDGNFSLWNWTPTFKKILFRRYKALPQANKTVHIANYMQINYGKDQQFLRFAKRFETNLEVINWYGMKLKPSEVSRIRFDFQTALQKRRINIQKLLAKYRLQYGGKSGTIDAKKNITYKRFLESLQYQKLTGQNIMKNPRLKKIYQRQKEYYTRTYHTDKVKQEIHSCIAIPTYNNVVDHRYIWNLESVLQQDYQNYRLIIIDDASSDGTAKRIAQHLKWRGVDKNRVVLLRNKYHRTAMPNIYYALHKYCDYNQIFYILDGDDEIVGTQVLKLYNTLYQEKKIYVLYSAHFKYQSQNQTEPLPLGLPYAYPEQVKKEGTYRTFDHAYSQLRSVMSDLLLLLKAQSLKDEKGIFYWTISDNALFFPAMQLSCGRVEYIPELVYWYNANTGINDWRTPEQKDYIRVKKHINFVQKHYQCIHMTINQIRLAVKNDYRM